MFHQVTICILCHVIIISFDLLAFISCNRFWTINFKFQCGTLASFKPFLDKLKLFRSTTYVISAVFHHKCVDVFFYYRDFMTV